MSYFLNYIEFLSNLGYNVITFDYRGFGGSSNFEIDKNLLYHNEFSEDFNIVLNHYTKEINNKIIILSLSMGTIVTVLGLENFKNLKIDKLIFESCVYDDYKIIERLKVNKKKIIKSPNVENKLIEKWDKIYINIFILIGINDNITTIEDAKNIASKRKNRKVIELEGEHLSSLHYQKVTSKNSII